MADSQAPTSFMRLMTKGMFGDYLDTVAAERRDDFDSPVDLQKVYALQELISESPRPFSSLAAFVPPSWKRPDIQPLSNIEEYSAVSDTMFSMAGTRIETPCGVLRLVAAGGAVRHMLYNKYTVEEYTNSAIRSESTLTLEKPADIDYFAVADSEKDYAALQIATQEQMVEIARNIVSTTVRTSFCSLYSDTETYSFSVSRGVITLISRSRGVILKQVQIILRGPYKTAGAVISGFDLPACAVYLDRRDGAYGVRFTTGGAYAAATGLQIVDVANRSTTFASRIAKYMARGVGIVLPEISPDEVRAEMEANPEGFIIDTLDYRLHVLRASMQANTEPNMWRCQIQLMGGPNQKLTFIESDYSEEPDSEDLLHKDLWYYSATVTAIKHLGRETDPRPFKFYIRGSVEEFTEDMPRILVPATVGEHLNTLEEHMARDDSTITSFILALAKTQRPGYHIRTIMNSFTLRDVLGMNSETLEAVQKIVQHAWERRPYNIRYVDFRNLIVPYVEAALARMRERASEPIDLWVRFDPQRQWWTASMNPAVVDAVEYYNEFIRDVDRRAPAGHVSPVEEKAEEEVGVDEEQPPPREVETDKCPLCHEWIYPGGKNTITLPCGHIMCYTVSRNCGGWVSVRRISDRCPMCRELVCNEEQDAEENFERLDPIVRVRPGTLVLDV